MSLLTAEVVVLLNAYLLAGIPIAGAWLAGKASPMYRLERAVLLRYWSRMALGVVVSAWLVGAA